MSDEEMKAIIDTAHSLYKKVTAHVYAAPSIIKMAHMGIDELQHCSLITEEAARLLEEKNIPIVPTFCPYDEIIRMDEENLRKKDAKFQEKLRFYAPRLIAGRETIINSTIKLGFGSDLVTVHRSYEGAYEYESWMLSGMDPFRILRAATATNAELLEISDIVGTIQPGKLADLAAWKHDLLTDPRAFLDCAFVMKDGKVYETEKIE